MQPYTESRERLQDKCALIEWENRDTQAQIGRMKRNAPPEEATIFEFHSSQQVST